jgi:hypothetical protein
MRSLFRRFVPMTGVRNDGNDGKKPVISRMYPAFLSNSSPRARTRGPCLKAEDCRKVSGQLKRSRGIEAYENSFEVGSTPLGGLRCRLFNAG